MVNKNIIKVCILSSYLLFSPIYTENIETDLLEKKFETELFAKQVKKIADFLENNIGEVYNANYADQIIHMRKLLHRKDVQKIIGVPGNKIQLYNGIYEHLTKSNPKVASIFCDVIEPKNMDNQYVHCGKLMKYALNKEGIQQGAGLTTSDINKVLAFQYPDMFTGRVMVLNENFDEACNKTPDFLDKLKENYIGLEQEIKDIQIAKNGVAINNKNIKPWWWPF